MMQPSKEKIRSLLSRRPSFEPRVYFDSDSAEGFREAESTYCHGHYSWVTANRYEARREKIIKLDKPYNELSVILAKGGRPDSRLVIKCFQAIIDPRTMLAQDVSREVAIAVLTQISVWSADATYDKNPEAKKIARECLEAIARGLTRYSRGKKRPSISEWDLLGVYFSTVFRLYQAAHCIKTTPGNRVTKIKRAARNFAVPRPPFPDFPTEQWLRRLSGVNEEYDNAPEGPIRPTELARHITARAFKISERTLSNYLQHGRSRRRTGKLPLH